MAFKFLFTFPLVRQKNLRTINNSFLHNTDKCPFRGNIFSISDTLTPMVANRLKHNLCCYVAHRLSALVSVDIAVGVLPSDTSRQLLSNKLPSFVLLLSLAHIRNLYGKNGAQTNAKCNLIEWVILCI